jgi:integrase
MKDDRMSKLPGLHLRAGTYQLRTMVPLDLRPAYGRSRLIESLGTSNAREANLIGSVRRAELLQEFESKRVELSPQRLDVVSPELALTLAQRVGATVLRQDDWLRDDPKTPAMLWELQAVTQAPLYALKLSGGPAAPPAPRSALDGLSQHEAAALADLNSYRDADAAASLATRYRATVLPLVVAEARKLGLTFDPSAPGAREALSMALQHYRQAAEAVVARDAGAVVLTPPEAPAVVPAKPIKLREVFTRWKASKTRTDDSVAGYERALVLFEEFTGNPDLIKLARHEGDSFRAFLLGKGTATKTAHGRLTAVKTLLKYATQELELIPRNPWAGLKMETTTTNKRKPWSEEQLSKLFAGELFTSYTLPAEWRAGKDAAYWIPLLALYSGARVSELCQLTVKDIDARGSVPMLSITDEGEGQQVKTSAGVRTVPIHSELIRLGFLDYVGTLPPEGSLWPALRQRKDKPGGYFSDWFGKYRNAHGLGHDFHSFRHTVRSELVEAGISEPIIDRLCGHEAKGSTGAKVYTHHKPETLRKAVEALSFPRLPRAYRDNTTAS